MLNTHQLSISQAARVANISRSHLYNKYIHSGRISVSETMNGTKYIDASEVARVFNKSKAHETLSKPHPDFIKDALTKLKKENEQLQASNEKLKFSLMLIDNEVTKQSKREEFLQKTVVALTHRLTNENTGKNTPRKQVQSGLITRLIRWLV